MPRFYWTRRFVIAFIAAGVVLCAAHLVRGHALADSIGFGLLWGAIAAVIFTVVGYLRYRRNPACMLPRPRRPDA